MVLSKQLSSFLAIVLLLATATHVDAQTPICGSNPGIVVNTNAWPAITTYTCTCPAGTGLISPQGSAAPVPGATLLSGNGGAVTFNSTNANGVTTIAIIASGSLGYNIAMATDSNVLALCDDLMPGYTLVTAASASLNIADSITTCPVGRYCPGLAVVFNGTLPSPLVSGDFSTGGAAAIVLASNTAFTGSITVAGTTGAPLAKTSPACPAGTTNAITGGSLVGTAAVDATVCDDLAPGYAILSAIAAQSTAGASVNLTSGITPCAAGFYCPGKALGVNAITAGTTGSTFTWTTFQVTAATACPTGTTWAGSASASATSAAVCDDLAAGYYIPSAIAAQAAAGAVTALTAGIQQCPVGSYCPGLVGAISTGNGGITAGTTGNTFTWNLVQAVPAAACPAGSTSAVGSTSSSACNIVAPGYYIDQSALNTPVVCPAGKYCPGGGAIGTVGGDMNCPTGSVGPAIGGAQNSNINDCIVSSGFYIDAGAVNTPAPCPSGYICTGGGPVGTAGGSVQCPTGSTNAACPSTVNGAPVTAANAAVLSLAALAALAAF